MELAIETRGVQKSYGRHRVLAGLDLKVPSGLIYGLVGPNGAGKTTLIRILLGVVRPDAGEVLVEGQPVDDRVPQWKSHAGYVPDLPDVYYNLRVSEFFALGKRFYPGWDEEASARLLRPLSLPREQRLRELSRGQRTQVALVFALSHHPRYLFLDEPTAGLDPLVRRKVLRLVLEEAADRGTTVIYSTHNLADLERACDRIGLLHGGTITMEKAVDELKAGATRIQVVWDGEAPPQDPGSWPEVAAWERRERMWLLTVTENAAQVVEKIKATQPAFLEELPLSLEEWFIAVVEGRVQRDKARQ
jgi:ABC-2 type transport system ATP-binding protein